MPDDIILTDYSVVFNTNYCYLFTFMICVYIYARYRAPEVLLQSSSYTPAVGKLLSLSLKSWSSLA